MSFPRLQRCLLLLLVLVSGPARADSHLLHYTARLLGVKLLDIAYCVQIGDGKYTTSLAAHTVGLIDLVWHGQSTAFAAGRLGSGKLAPDFYEERGKLGGEANHVRIAYEDGRPVLKQMTPPQSKYRFPVLPQNLAGALDGLSAIVLELNAATTTKTCLPSVLVYDGLQLRRGTISTAGMVPFQRYRNSIFSGQALRCDTRSTLLAGFLKDHAIGPQARPHFSSEWTATLTADGVFLPLRLTFNADFLGDISVDLDRAETAPGACADPL